MAISKKARFEVFKRDGFVCQYCGVTPPKAILETDHIQPRSRGGGDEMDNLITACFDCNRGKGAVVLSSIPQTIAAKAELLKEREEQLRQYQLLTRKRARRVEADLDRIETVFQEFYPSFTFTATFRISLTHFLDELTSDVLEWAMRKACAKGLKTDEVTKYFCGICWRTIRQDRRWL